MPIKTVRAAIADSAGFPEDTLGGVSNLTVYGSGKLTAEGCTGIISCDENEIRLRMCDGSLIIKGSSLLPLDFHYRTFSVRGNITQISFDNAK